MIIPKKELTPGQTNLLGKSLAAMDAQLQLARDLVRSELQLDPKDHPEHVLAMAQILATNYAATVVKEA